MLKKFNELEKKYIEKEEFEIPKKYKLLELKGLNIIFFFFKNKN
jgi:hypothetical protein